MEFGLETLPHRSSETSQPQHEVFQQIVCAMHRPGSRMVQCAQQDQVEPNRDDDSSLLQQECECVVHGGSLAQHTNM